MGLLSERCRLQELRQRWDVSELLLLAPGGAYCCTGGPSSGSATSSTPGAPLRRPDMGVRGSDDPERGPQRSMDPPDRGALPSAEPGCCALCWSLRPERGADDLVSGTLG